MTPPSRVEPITIEGIAARAGVSPGTVSRVLNGKNKENRPSIAKRADRIRHIATEFGYRPNMAARSVVRGRFNAVAFVTCGDRGTDWYPISGLNGIHAALDAVQWRLLFNELPAEKINNPKFVPQLFRELAVDGCIVNLLPAFHEGVIDYFEAQPSPCVWQNLKRKLRSVYPDEATGAAMAVQWLVERGHTRIGYFHRSFHEPAHYSAADRYHGFERAMGRAGLNPRRRLDLFQPAGAAPAPVWDRAEAFLTRFPDVQAVVCYEYEEAICLAMAAERAGRRVPRDLDLVGFNEREIRSTSGITIPTAIVPFEQVGRQAVAMLRQMIESRNHDVPSVAVPFQAVLS